MNLKDNKSNIPSHLGSLCLLLAIFGLASCSNTKYLQDGQQLYIGADVNVESKGKIPDKDQLKQNLEENISPKPNKTILGLRPQLWFYNIAGTPKGKGLRYFLKNKLGKPPVLFEDVKPDANADMMVNYLENHGYFQPKVGYQVVNKGEKKVKLQYTVTLNSPYRYYKIDFPKGDSGIVGAIAMSRDESLLKEGDIYNLDVLKQERARIETALKDEGYFYFTADNLIFKIDSSIGNRQLNVYLRIKPDLPPQATRQYAIQDVFVYMRYSLGRDSSQQKVADTIHLDSYHFIGKRKPVRPKVLTRSLFIKPHKLYSRTDYDKSLNRLMDLGVYKFVNMRFEEAADSSGKIGGLNAYLYLVPLPKKTMRTELRLVTQSNNFAGPQLNITFRNRNFLGGAEHFTTNIHGAFETLLSSRFSGFSTYEVGGDIALEVPRFLVPFRANTSSQFVPRTRMSLGYDMTNRIEYFMINDFNAKFGYLWQEDVKRQHELYPINIDYYQLSHTTDKFHRLIEGDKLLQRSFENQFILGSSYSYTFNQQADNAKPKRTNFFFKGNIDLSGNLAYLFTTKLLGHESIKDTPFTIFGSPYAQFARFGTDFRYYLNFTNQKKLVFRLAPGVGIPYGNSNTLPYARQFFVGGNNSVRAFQPRTLGPGSYDVRKDLNKAFFLGEGGDMQLLGNIEYRFNYTGIFNGAFFMDAGNTWLVRPQEGKPEGLFNAGRFYKEVALGIGTGLRVDASIFVLRLDLAYPLRKPYLPQGERWIRLGTQEWNGNEMVLNIAIGYPF